MNQKPSVHRLNGFKGRFGRREAGFSLIEILVVISILALIISVGVVMGSRMTAEARKTQTKSMLQALIAANDEFRAVRQQGNINHDGAYPINWADQYTNGSSMSSSERFVAGCRQIPAAEQIMLAAINSGASTSNKKLLADSNSNNYDELIDRWGTQIEYRTLNDGTGSGPGTGVSNTLLPISRAPIFVSAGPDKSFDTMDDNINSLPDGSTQDN